ncbi:MAG: acetate--CoA ligase family protein [Pseudomonadota bacterium]
MQIRHACYVRCCLLELAFRKAPISLETAKDMLGELKGMALLKGARGNPPADIDALAVALSRLSVFAAAHGDTLESVEMNPVRAMPEGVMALDALIVKA